MKGIQCISNLYAFLRCKKIYGEKNTGFSRRVRRDSLRSVLMIMLTGIFISGMLLQSKAEAVSAEESGSEIVFLLDASNSMNTQDKNRFAIDAICQMAGSLPSDYKVGVVAYNTEIQMSAGFDTDMRQMEDQLRNVTYKGYTNAGEGMTEALKLFSDQGNVKRYIVMMSDGEIMMKGDAETDQSRAVFAEAVNQAKEKGIKIYIAAIGNELVPGMHIFDAAEITDGAIYWEGMSGSLSQIMNSVISDRFGFPRRSVGVTDGNGGSLHVDVPGGADRMKILLTGDGGIGEVTADYTAESGHTITGQRFAVVDVNRPASQAVDVYFHSADISSVRAYVLTEFTAKPQVSVLYRSEEKLRTEEEIKKNVPPQYDHFADITIQMTDTAGKIHNLWGGTDYEGREIVYTVNGVSYTGTLQQGQIHLTIPADGVEQAEVTVDTGNMEDVYYIEQPVSAAIEKYPDPPFEPEPDYRPLWIILGILGVTIVVLAAWWIKKSRTTFIYVAQPSSSKEPPKKLETKSCFYSGKFNMYVVRTENGRDIPPQTFRLFGRQGGRLSLDRILTDCGIKFGKIGAADIIFYPGPDQSVIIMDQSERCTIMRGTELLKKGMGYPVFYNEKITVSFEDEATEMEIHYKNLKPSEREAI